MKTLIVAVALILVASIAMAEAPCQNPVAPVCRKSCAVIGAKFILTMREQTLTTPVREQNDKVGSIEKAQRLARLAGLSLYYIDNLTVPQINRALAIFCPR